MLKMKSKMDYPARGMKKTTNDEAQTQAKSECFGSRRFCIRHSSFGLRDLRLSA